MLKAYSNNGTSWRYIDPELKADDGSDVFTLTEGEVAFDHDPTEAELDAAFPSRSDAALTTVRARALGEIRAQRAPLLDALAGIGFDALVAGDTVTAQAVAAARAGLKDLPTLPEFLAATTYDEMRVAVMTRYKQLAAAAPETVQIAFAKLFE